jgi:hypothetical protein
MLPLPEQGAINILILLLWSVQVVFGLSDHTKDSVDHLWRQVEQNIPVEFAKQQSVVETPVHIDVGYDPTEKSIFKAKTLTESRIDHLRFKKKFMYGVASAAAQVEGAVKSDGRGPSIWDSFCHSSQQAPSQSCQSIDVGTNFRFLYPVDIARVAAMNVKSYSFSVSWSRVIPLGELRAD